MWLKKRLYCFVLFVVVWGISCGHSRIQQYLQDHQDLDPQIILALQHEQVINGMTQEEVKIILGEPIFIEKKQPQQERWIYHGQPEKKSPQELEESAFPQGIGYVIPLAYHAQEILIDFVAGKVVRIEQILNF